jgi:hypothetical protein
MPCNACSIAHHLDRGRIVNNLNLTLPCSGAPPPATFQISKTNSVQTDESDGFLLDRGFQVSG